MSLNQQGLLSGILKSWSSSQWKVRPTRVGRGVGSTKGKTSGNGHQKKRPGGHGIGFEGGQNPVYKRLPKRGGKLSPIKLKNKIFVIKAEYLAEKLSSNPISVVDAKYLKEVFRIPHYYRFAKLIDMKNANLSLETKVFDLKSSK